MGYTGRVGSCQYTGPKQAVTSCSVAIPTDAVTGHTDVGKSSAGLKSALSEQPVSVTVNAGQLQFYGNGVVTGTCSGQINHAVIAVGYGTDGTDYFNIRNTWGTSWGESGYIRLGQNGGSQGTACLFQYAPVTPKLSSKLYPPRYTCATNNCPSYDPDLPCQCDYQCQNEGNCPRTTEQHVSEARKQHLCEQCHRPRVFFWDAKDIVTCVQDFGRVCLWVQIPPQKLVELL